MEYTRTDPSKDTIKCKWHLGTKEPSPHTKVEFTPHPPKIMDTILDAIGHTPMVRLNRIPQSQGLECEFLAKCEFLNAGGSLKDRIGKRMLLDAEKSGRIKPGDTLIEATSGNTGIGLTLASAVKGYNMIITLPEKMSTEKTDVLNALGAQIYRTPTQAAFDDPDSHLNLAFNLEKSLPNAHVLDQYQNPGNPLAHYDETAEEILWQCDGQLDALVISAGTGGTVAGIGRKIQEKLPNCQIIAVDPHGSILAQPQDLNTWEGSYFVEGIGYDFIPRVIDRSVVDDWIKSEDKSSLIMARRLIREEGYFCGGSSGATLQGAIDYAQKAGLKKGDRVVVLLADNIRNYITKLVSQEWMVEKNFMEKTELTAGHKLEKIPVSQLKLKPSTLYTEQLTVGEAIAAFEKGEEALPIVIGGKIKGVVFQDKLLTAITNKGLKKDDLAKQAWTNDYTVFVAQTVDCALVSQMLERRKVVLLTEENQQGQVAGVSAATHQDVLPLLLK